MRLRVLVILGSLMSLIVLIVGWIVLQQASRDLTQDLQLNRLTSVNRFVQLASHAQESSDLTMLRNYMDHYSQLYDEGLLITIGERTLRSGDIDPAQPAVADAVRNASLNLETTGISVLTPFDSSTVVIARPYGNMAQVLGSVVMEVNTEAARAKVLRTWAAVALISLLLLVALLLLADRLTTWMLRPMHRLEDEIRELARTRRTRPLSLAGPPELRALTASVQTMSDAMDTSLRQQRMLIAETSHQLRNPVAALRLRIDLLRHRLGAESERLGADQVDKELDRLEDMLNDVLQLASAEHRVTQQEAGGSLPESEPTATSFDARELLEEECERQRMAAEHAGVDLRVHGPYGLFIRANPFEIQQIVAEALTNAFKYAPGAPVDLRCIEAGSHVLLSLRDHGAGLSQPELEQATERFWRAETVRSERGSGLGLTIVERLTRANEGTLDLRPAPGGGLEVCVKLPAAGLGVGQ
ncbi:sensor histidine kinase [Glutamicibacter endophyticus]|uniref:sensor histidine kinase n=1 Tax=Glutamicibacter endophyticus TaxID=1522174 RepID=UPI003AEFD338